MIPQPPKYYMNMALSLAREAYAGGEVPVGCVIVHDDKVIGCGYNKREGMQNALLHAEIIAINEACAALNSWRLTDCDLYVTLEPCPMCAGAILNARLGRVYYGASDTNMGACGGVMNIYEEAFGYRPKLYGGLLAKESSMLLSDFFKNLR